MSTTVGVIGKQRGEVSRLNEYLQSWRAAGLTETGEEKPVKRPRSFRPSFIVPRLYLGAAKDVRDVLALRRRLVPERLLMVVSTCDLSYSPRLELHQISPTEGVKFNVRRLAVFPWEALEGQVAASPTKERPSADEVLSSTTEWLRQVFQTRYFSPSSRFGGCCKVEPEGGNDCDTCGCSNNQMYLKLYLPWKDDDTFAVRPHFPVATALMHAIISGLRGAVVCYCMAGKSRSATLVCALLLYCFYNDIRQMENKKQCTAHEAVRVVVNFVRESRLCVGPNEGFMRQLREFAKVILSTPHWLSFCKRKRGSPFACNIWGGITNQERAMGVDATERGDDVQHTERNMAESEDGVAPSDDVISVLLCKKCETPITDYGNILGQREESVWTEQVYAYEVELFATTPPLWCYSATNPHGRRFDIMRCTASAVSRDRTVMLQGPWSGEHSFFVGHKWSYAACTACGSFLGWGFWKTDVTSNFDGDNGNGALEGSACLSINNTSDIETDGNSVASSMGNGSDGASTQSRDEGDNCDAESFDPSVISFVGLIVTNCVGRSDYSRTKYNEIMSADIGERRRIGGNAQTEDVDLGTDRTSLLAVRYLLESDADVGIGLFSHGGIFTDISTSGYRSHARGAASDVQ